MYRENPAIFWTHDKTRQTIILRTRTHYEYACTFAWFFFGIIVDSDKNVLH